MARFIKKFLLFLAVVIPTMIVGLALLVFFVPQAFVNESTLGLVKNLAKRMDCELDWKDATVDVTSETIFRKAIALHFINFSAKCPQVDISGSRIDLGFALSLDPRQPRLPRLGPGLWRSGTVAVRLAAEEATLEDEEGFNVQSLLQFLSQTRIEPLSIDLRRWEVASAETTLSGSIRGSVARPKSDRIDVDFLATADRGGPFKTVQANGSFSSDPETGALLGAAVATTASFYDSRKISGTLDLNPLDKSRSQFEMAAKVVAGGTVVASRASGQVSRTEVLGRLSVDVKLPSKTVQSLGLSPCEIAIRSDDFLHDKIDASLNCDGAVVVKHRPVQDSPQSLLLPTRFGFKLNNTISVAAPKSDSRVVSFTSRAEMKDLRQDYLNVTGGFKVDGEIDLARVKEPNRLGVSFDTVARIKDFKTLVARLRGSRWLIPAPFNQLAGTSQCEASGTVNLITSALVVPVKCSTNLSSANQKFVVEATADVRANKGTDSALVTLNSQVVLRDVSLVLPDIDLTKPLPRLTRDKRIVVNEPPVNEAAAVLNYNIHVLSPKDKAVVIHNSLTKAPARLELDMMISNRETTTGTLKILPVDVSILRRNATIEYLTIMMKPGLDAPEIDGRIRVPGTVYHVFVSLHGTLSKPGYEVYSEPPLPEREALAVLLFGYEPQMMAEDEMRSADEMQAAMADGAINLLSMFFLASTPVESIGYNSYTGLFTARVRVREGVSLMVGSSADESGVIGLRKRISRNWAVEATATKSGEAEDDSSARAMLRWSKRF